MVVFDRGSSVMVMLERSNNEGILTLRMARGRANALDSGLLAELKDAFESTEDARAVILAGGGPIFSAGVDLIRLSEEGEENARSFFPLLVATFSAIFFHERPVVVACGGHALAGGCLLVLCGDHRVMASGAGRIGLPELTVGLPFPAIAHEIVRHAIAPRDLRSVLYGGAGFAPDQARDAGLIDEVCPPEDLPVRAQEAAARLAALPPALFAHTKRALRDPHREMLARRGAAADAAALELWTSAEARQRVEQYVGRKLRRSAP